MLSDTRSGDARHARISLVALSVAATVAAAFVAATAVPALANGSQGKSVPAHAAKGTHGKSAAAHAAKGTHGKSGTAHANKGTHGKSGTAHANKGTHGKSGTAHGNKGGNSANAHEHVTICHATPPDTAAHGYVQISPSASGVFHGHMRQHDADIIPPFLYSGQTYSLNWDATGQAIWNNGCAAPDSTNGASRHLSKREASQEAAAKAAFRAIIAALKPASRHTGGVLGAQKTLKRVSHHTRAARATTRPASFTG